MAKEKIQFIDVAKGIGIFLVVLGHTVIPEIRGNSKTAYALFDIIYSFHMPLFIALSGYLFELNIKKYEEKGYGQFILSKFKILLIPYLCYSVLSYAGINAAFCSPALGDILTKGGYEKAAFGNAVFQVLTNIDHVDKHLWFIYALFIIFAISFPLRKVTKSPVFLLALGVVYFFLPQAKVPYIVTRVILYMIYFSLSRHLTLIENWARKDRVLPALLLFAGLYALSFVNVAILKKLLEIPVAAAGSLAVLAGSAAIAQMKWAKPVIALGNYSYDIYLIHQPFLVSGLGGVLLMATNWPYAAICSVTLVIGIAIPILLSKYILRRVKILRILFLGGH